MMRKILLFFAFLTLTYTAALAQTGKLAGKLIDKTTKEPIPFGNIVVKLNGTQKGYGQTDINGNYSIAPLIPGSYSVEVPNVGYVTRVINGVEVTVDKTTKLDIDLSSTSVELGTVEITAYEIPIIGPEKVGQTISKEQIEKLATRDVSTAATNVAGVNAADDGRGVNINGARSAGTVYYVNGVKQITPPQLAVNSVSQMTVLTKGIPAQYGDAVGGIINITTSSPSSSLQGGVEAETSTILDKYDNNLLSFNLTGPLLKKRTLDTTAFASNPTLLGFFLSGQYQSSKDDNPFAQGVYHLKDDVRSRITASPYITDPQGGYTDAASKITLKDLEKNRVRENVKSNRVILNTSIDFQPKDNLMFTFGGNLDRSDRNLYVNSYSLFNSQNNPQQLVTNWNAYGRFTQYFKDKVGDSSANPLKNAFYQIQADYSKYDRIIQNERLKNNIFRYGYIGKFEEDRQTQYVNQAAIRLRANPSNPDDTTTVVFRNVNVDSGDQSNNLTFTDSGYNTDLANYTNYVLNDRRSIGAPINDLDELLGRRGWLNGYSPSPIYSIYAGQGSAYSQYALLNNDQFRLTALGSAEWGKHTFRLGFEFEQRVETNYAVNANGLWLAGRGLLDKDIDPNLDKTNYTFYTKNINGVDQTFIDFERKASGTQSTFSQNLRKKFGLADNEPINIDALSPEDLSLNMFSADELNDQGLVSYQGYSYDGVRNTKKVAFNDYFSNINRPQDANRPIYTSFWLEDKFQIEDLTLRAGLRIDRYDANQKVLKDPYTLVDVLHAKDVRDLQFSNSYVIPSNVGDDYVVYVNKSAKDFDRGIANTYEVTGYRKGDVFYDVNGTPTENITQITQGGTFPLFDPEAQGEVGKEFITDRTLSVKAFKDYVPQFSVMPRLSFSFPISEDALFFAHYDILTQRPERNGTLPSDYYYLQGSINDRNEINNPDLKPQKKIDYEVGFEQRLTKSSGLTISAFYSEMRDQISYRKYFGAYPSDYVTFGNLDFGTVKGLTLEYELRRTRNFMLNSSYTLQYAKGTGSSATSGFNLVSQGQPNLRTPIPLDYDTRHAFKLNLDYRLRTNEGPVLFGKKIFQNAGLNIMFQGNSGTPYSRQANITNFISAIGRPVLEGSMNGSRLPGNFRVGLKVDKDFNLKFKEGADPFIKTLNVYFRVQNLLDTKNVLNVYRYTGSPDDDGYLDFYRQDVGEAIDQNRIDIYTVRLLNGEGGGSNYSTPRRAYIGCTFTF